MAGERRMISMRVPVELLERWDVAAAGAGRNRTEWLVGTLDGLLSGRLRLVPNRGPAEPPVDQSVMLPVAAEQVPSAACRHPREREQRKSFGTWCGECGKRIR